MRVQKINKHFYYPISRAMRDSGLLGPYLDFVGPFKPERWARESYNRMEKLAEEILAEEEQCTP